MNSTTAKTPLKLSEGRYLHVLAEKATQPKLFGLYKGGLFSEETKLLSMKDIGELTWSNASDHIGVKSYQEGLLRFDEYVFFKKDPFQPLGKEIIWCEGGFFFHMKIDDIPVEVMEFQMKKVVSLQKARGVGVCSSTGLFKIEQMDDNHFLVSAIDPSRLVGNVRIVEPNKRVHYSEDEEYLVFEEDGRKYRYLVPEMYLTGSLFVDPLCNVSSAPHKGFFTASGWHGSMGFHPSQLRNRWESARITADLSWSAEGLVGVLSSSETPSLVFASNSF